MTGTRGAPRGLTGQDQQRLQDALKRVQDAERSVATARQTLTELCGGPAAPSNAPLSLGAMCSSPAIGPAVVACGPPAPAPGVPSGLSLLPLPAKPSKGNGRKENPNDAAAASRLGIPVQEVTMCRQVFSTADIDGSGKISMTELRVLLEKALCDSMGDVDYRKIMRRFDSNQDGLLDFEEFLHAYCLSPQRGSTNGDHFTDFLESMNQAGEDEGGADNIENRLNKQGVPRRWVRKYLFKETSESDACMQLPLASVLFVCFILAYTFHFRTAELHAVDKAVTWDIEENANFAFSGNIPFEQGRMGHKNIFDINTIADFWSWMNLGITPLFWPEGWSFQEARANVMEKCVSAKEALKAYGYAPGNISDVPEWPVCPEDGEVSFSDGFRDLRIYGNGSSPTYLYFNTIVGGMRMRQEHMDVTDCDARDQDLVQAVHPGKCIRNLGYWLIPELGQSLEFRKDLEGTVDTASSTMYLLSRWPQSKVRQELRHAENTAWASPQTKKIELLFTTYNPHEDLLTATFIIFFFNNGGHIHKVLEPISLWVHPYHDWMCWVADFSWLCIVLKIFVEEVMDLSRSICIHGPMMGFYKYVGPANFVDWISIGAAATLVYFWLRHQFALGDLRALIRQADHSVTGSWTDAAIREEFFNTVENIVKESIVYRTLLAVYPFVIVSRFFKAFSSQPRLAVVTRTISVATVDIIHFLVVFLLVFTVYSTSAMILFGQENAYFANFMRSFFSVFRILIGDFDWTEMHQVGRPQAYLWFLSFMVLLNWVMLNMLLAIIMDVYTSVKGNISADAETLWSQSYEIYKRKRDVLAGKMMALNKILAIIDPEEVAGDEQAEEDTEPPFTIYSFVSEVQGLREEQAKDILTESVKYGIALDAADIAPSMADAVKKIAAIQGTIETLAYNLELAGAAGGVGGFSGGSAAPAMPAYAGRPGVVAV